MNELTTSIVGIDFPNEDKSNSNRRMEWMLCAPGDLVELRLEPTNPFDDNAVAIFSDRGTQLGYVSAERAPLIGKRMKEDDATAVFQAMHGNGAYIRIRFGGGLPTVVEGFREMIRRKTEADLVPWIERGRGSLVASFADGIARDVAAVRAAIVAPQARDSGQYRGKRHIRGGRTVLRQALYMPALVATRFNVDLRAKYQALVTAGKPPKVAITAYAQVHHPRKYVAQGRPEMDQ